MNQTSEHSTHIKLNKVSHHFFIDKSKVTLFSDLNLRIHQGESHAITGPSGSGKSSLLMLISGLAQPSSGEVMLITGTKTVAIDSLRAKIGFIFQQFHLLPEMNVLNNVALPLKLRGDKQAIEKAKHYLAMVGLNHRLNLPTNKLSGGEQQRVANARALVYEPPYIFADEPTGNLDPYSAAQVTELLFKCCEKNKAGLVIVTHSKALAERTKYQFDLTNINDERLAQSQNVFASEDDQNEGLHHEF